MPTTCSWQWPLKVLYGETRVDLDVLARDTRILSQRHEHVRAVLEICLWFCRSRTASAITKFPDIINSEPNAKMKKGLTSFFNTAASFNPSIFSCPYSNPHSVSSKPGRTAFALTFAPCVLATHLTKCNCAAFVTEYAILLPPIVRPAIELVTSTTPPSAFASKVGIALLTSAFTPSTFVRQHRSHSSSLRASKSAKSEKRVQPALAITTSRPPRSWIAVCTRLAICAVEPASALIVVVLMFGWAEESSLARSEAAVALLA